MHIPTGQIRFDTLVTAIAARRRTGLEYDRWCRLVAVLSDALPAAEVTRAHQLVA